jgi:hypothetical protein
MSFVVSTCSMLQALRMQARRRRAADARARAAIIGSVRVMRAGAATSRARA